MSGHDNEVVKTMLRQITNKVIMAVCGGKYERSGPQAVRMHAGCGYRVEVTYEEGSDTYTVERLYERAGKITVKGTRTWVYAQQLNVVVWDASCWRNVPFGEEVIDYEDGVMWFGKELVR